MSDWEVEKPQIIKVSDIVGTSLEDAFSNFDITDIQNLLKHLQNTSVPDLAHAEYLQQQALRCADILSEHISKLVKTIHYLEAQLSAKKNKAALEYSPPKGVRLSIELRKMAGESSSEVGDLQLKLAKAKGSKSLLDKKYEITLKAHHHYKEIASGLKKTILGYSAPMPNPDE